DSGNVPGELEHAAMTEEVSYGKSRLSPKALGGGVAQSGPKPVGRTFGQPDEDGNRVARCIVRRIDLDRGAAHQIRLVEITLALEHQLPRIQFPGSRNQEIRHDGRVEPLGSLDANIPEPGPLPRVNVEGDIGRIFGSVALKAGEDGRLGIP